MTRGPRVYESVNESSFRAAGDQEGGRLACGSRISRMSEGLPPDWVGFTRGPRSATSIVEPSDEACAPMSAARSGLAPEIVDIEASWIR